MEYRIIKNEEHNGLEIYFGEKPSEEIRAALKEIKFRWHGVKKCWYGRAELSTVENILGGKVSEVKTERAEILKKCFCKTVDAYLDPDGGYKGSNSGVSAYDVPDKAREIIKACGIKGVTVSKHLRVDVRGNHRESASLGWRREAVRGMPRMAIEARRSPDVHGTVFRPLGSHDKDHFLL